MGVLGDLRDDLERIAPGYGVKIMVQLFLTYFFFCKSLSYSLVMDSWFPVMTRLVGVSAVEVTDLYVVVRAPWAMKPFWAVLSDTFPIYGYRKRFIILVAVCIALLGMFLIAFATPTDGPLAAFYFLLIVLGSALCDSMSQARYTELMKASGSATIVSYVWFLINAGGLFSFYNLLLANEGLGDWRHKILVVIAIPISLPMLYPAAMNWLAEEPMGDGKCCSPNYEIIKQNVSIFILSTVTFFVTFGGVVVQLLTSPVVMFGITARWINGIFYLAGAVLILVCCQLCLPKSIALPAIYMFMCKALFLNIAYILQAFYTSPAGPPGSGLCFPNSPEFTNSYYQTVSGYGGTIASLLGVVVFNSTVQYWNVRAAFWVTTAVNCLTTVFDLLLVERWNQRILGYDINLTEKAGWADQIFFIFGAQAIDRLLDMLDSLPQTVLIGKLCPKNMEAQVFAILAALSNFGNSVAGVNGGIIALAFGVNIKEEKDGTWTCTNPPGALGISSLGWVKIIATFILPLTTIPFTWICLPNRRLDEDMLEEEGEEVELQQGTDAPPAGLSGALVQGGRTTSTIYDPKKSNSSVLWVQASKTSLLSGAGKQLLL